jgi:hypothetical protein
LQVGAKSLFELLPRYVGHRYLRDTDDACIRTTDMAKKVMARASADMARLTHSIMIKKILVNDLLT